MSFSYDKTWAIVNEWVIWEVGQPEEGDCGHILIAAWIATALGCKDANEFNNIEGISQSFDDGRKKVLKQKAYQASDCYYGDVDDDPLFATKEEIVRLCARQELDLSAFVPGKPKEEAKKDEAGHVVPSTEVPSTGATEIRLSATQASTFDVMKDAYASAATGKLVVGAEKKIIEMVKAKLRTVAGWENLPDHPAYDRLILSFLPVIGREALLRSPLSTPRDLALYAADCTIKYQAVKNTDDFGDALHGMIKEAVAAMIELGSSIKQSEGSLLLGLELLGETESVKVKEKAKVNQ